MRNRLGVIGFPLGHSLSPEIHTAAIKDLGLNLIYEKWPMEKEVLPSFIADVRKSESTILGFNVTIPYKETIMPLLDEISDRGKAIGAINTVIYREGLLIGENTDGIGFIESLLKEGLTIENKKVLIIGTGGAAKGIGISLAFSGLMTIDFIGRSREKAKDLVAGVAAIMEDSSFYSFLELRQMDLSGYDYIIQTTPLGMKGIKGQLDFPYDHLNNKQVLVDIIYNPLKTNFLKEGEKRGLKTVNGVGMLVCQGAEAFRLWTGTIPNRQLMENTLLTALLEAQNE